MKNIEISIVNRVARNMTPDKQVVCGNTGYTVTFEFDSEWDSEPNKIARFVYHKNGKRFFEEAHIVGNMVDVPVLKNIDYVMVGVYGGDLTTTTSARVLCERSILCGEQEEVLTEAQKQSIMAELAKNVYIVGAEINADNHLVLNMSDGGVFDAGEIPAPKDGGYYTPIVSQIDETTVRISFEPSDEWMPPVEDVTINLPRGADGKEGKPGVSIVGAYIMPGQDENGSPFIFVEGATLTEV